MYGDFGFPGIFVTCKEQKCQNKNKGNTYLKCWPIIYLYLNVRVIPPPPPPVTLTCFELTCDGWRFCCCRYLDSWTCLCGPETSGSCTRKLPGSRAALREPLRELEVFPRGILRESRSAVNYWSESIGSNKLCRYLSLSYYQSINGVLIRVW